MLTIAAAGPETTIVFILVTISDQIADSVPETSLTKHKSARIRGFKPNRSTHSIPCKCACVAWVPMPPAQRPAPGPPRRAAGPEMAMACWPMAALLASVAPIGRHQSDVRGMPPAWNRSAAAELMVGRWH